MGIENDDEIGDEKAALAMLSPEERAALSDDAQDDADIAKKIAGDDDTDGDTDADDGKAAAKTAAKKVEPDDDADDDADDDTDEDDGQATAKAAQVDDATAKADDNAAEIVPIVMDLSPIDVQYKDAIKALNDEKTIKLQEMMDGVITAKEYSDYEAGYLANRDAAAADRNDRMAWFREVNEFQNKVLKESGINYSTDTKMNAAFDRWIKQLAMDPDNAQKDGSWFLSEAHEMVKTQYRIADTAAPKKAPAAEAPKTRAGKAPNTSNLPPTLARLPAASEADTGDEGEFAHIERLSGIERERALARMTPEQEDRYLRS